MKFKTYAIDILVQVVYLISYLRQKRILFLQNVFIQLANMFATIVYRREIRPHFCFGPIGELNYQKYVNHFESLFISIKRKFSFH